MEFKNHRKCYTELTFGFSILMKETNHQNQGEQSPSTQSISDWQSVKAAINERVIYSNEAVSMVEIHRLYLLKPDDSRYRNKLKERIINEFDENVTFLRTGHNDAEILINSNVTKQHNRLGNEDCITRAANFIREDIMEYAKKISAIGWPPCPEELLKEERKPPESILTFLLQLLQPNRPDRQSDAASERILRLIDSYAADIVHGVTKGKVFTAKHVLLSLGLHNLTGNKQIVEIVNKLGHGISYNLTCEIETAQAERAQMLSQSLSLLSLNPVGGETVLTIFWVDNFDTNVDRTAGGGAINTTHLVAFQEKQNEDSSEKENISITRSKRRKIDVIEFEIKNLSKMDVKKEPKLFRDRIETDLKEEKVFDQRYFIWCCIRKLNASDQTVSSLSGWLLKQRQFTKVTQTVLTYLPPIPKKVTDFQTIIHGNFAKLDATDEYAICQYNA